MREIKFRGKSADDNKWVFGDIQHIYGKLDIVWEDGFFGQEVDPKTVGQFTGLTDKNGKEIYEGDLLKDSSEDTGVIWEVVYNEKQAAFCLKEHDIIGTAPLGEIMMYYPHLEVIGNIHDHPEPINKEARNDNNK